ncbi:multidrug resistance-associated protein 1-like isoform X2 [Watersipora subatra]|uniref:multidrug resistance-associated protein 1-like isoform X2 n=1 Tax=Watersipora subatra TaxID=2589382 RepID=UPI00355ACEBE
MAEDQSGRTQFELFCGSELWNSNLSWNTENGSLPDFTRCFQETIASWVPCGFFWICLPFYLYYLSTENKDYVQKASVFTATKSILALLLAALALFDFGFSVAVRFYNKDWTSPLYISPAAYVSAMLELVTMSAAAMLIQWYRLRGKFTSGVLWCYWLLWCIGSFIPFYSKIVHFVNIGRVDDIPGFTTKVLYFVLCLLQFILASISDADIITRKKFESICPEHICSFPAFLTFSWFTRTVATGYKKELTRDDLWDLGPYNSSGEYIPPFETDWDQAVAKWRREKSKNCGHSMNITEKTESDPLIATSRKTKEPPLSLLRVILKHHGATILIALTSKTAYDLIQFVCPFLQSQLMNLVMTRTDEHVPGTTVAPAWQGYLLTVLLITTQIIMSILFQHMWYGSMVAGFRIRASIIAILYKKALKLGAEAKEKASTSEIVNLMAIDGQRMQDVFSELWVLPSSPISLVVCLWQLYINVGPSVFLGFGLMILTIPINGIIAAHQKAIQVKQMRLKDTRIMMTNEVLSGIKVSKLYAWEPSFEEKISAIRAEEMKNISVYWRALIAQYAIITSALNTVIGMIFTIYVFTEEEHILTPTAAYVTLSLFNILRAALLNIPAALSATAMASASLNRIVNFLKNSDLAENSVENDGSLKGEGVKIINGTFSWSPESQIVLRNVNFEVPTGSLTAVVGQVGSGKSSLLSACLGDMYKCSGKVISQGSVAFVAQQAWVQNGTVRENITFGKKFDQKKYDQIIKAVALAADFSILKDGDQTLIGEKVSCIISVVINFFKLLLPILASIICSQTYLNFLIQIANIFLNILFQGINLSGGQKQRVSLARACYSESDLYLFDDPLSAVDAHVGKHIFEQVIGHNGLLKEKTRVLVTHGLQWLPEVDRIFVLTNGRITETGSYDTLLAQKGAFAQLIDEYAQSTVDEESDEETEPYKMQIHGFNEDCSREEHSTSLILSSVFSSYAQSAAKGKEGLASVRLENLASGQLTSAVYKFYGKAIGSFWNVVTVLMMLFYVLSTAGANVWLSMWTDDEIFFQVSRKDNKEEQWATTVYYLLIYWLMVFMQSLAFMCETAALAYCSISASKFLHKAILKRILRLEMAFFDTRPLGQILNRFSKDIDIIDNSLGLMYLKVLYAVSAIVSAVVTIMYGTPIFFLFLAPFGLCYYFIYRYFIRALLQIKRMEAVTRSPIFTNFSETIVGAQTIRAFGAEKRFIKRSENFVEENNLFFYAETTANRWMLVRLQMMSGVLVGVVAGLCVLSTQIALLQNYINSSIAGLAITYSLFTAMLFTMVTHSLTDFETNAVSVERVKEYTDLPLEADWVAKDAPSRQWPTRGGIKFQYYSTKYRPELNLVLKELDLSIKPKEKVGIVGRTGAGKSSMTVALFRLIEAHAGSISIDGVNIESIGLHQLRNKLTILPQDPTVFAGNIRDNLDPFNQYSDDKIWEVLEQSYLKEYVEDQPEKLEYDCGESGSNLSVGQRQLVCLARALLRKTKILVLDEATAAVDMETDDLIQKTIRTAFADCTVLTIAHRLNTIMDSDRILVLDKGMVAEFDTPENLLKDEEGLFNGMVMEAGLKTK